MRTFCGGPLILRAGIIKVVRSALSLRWFKRWRDYRSKYLDFARYNWEPSIASTLKPKSLKAVSTPTQLTVEHIDNYYATAECFWWTLYKQSQQNQTHCQIFNDSCSLHHFYRDLRNNANVIQSQGIFRVYPALKNEFVRHLGGFGIVTNYRLFVRVQFQGWIPIALCDLKTYHLDDGPFTIEWVQDGESKSLSLTGEGLTPSSVHSARSKTKSSWDQNQKMLLYTPCSEIPAFHEVRHFGWVSSYRLEKADVDFSKVPTKTFPEKYSKEEEQLMALAFQGALTFLGALYFTIQFLVEQGDDLAVSLFSGVIFLGISWFFFFIFSFSLSPLTTIAFLSPENREPNIAIVVVKFIQLVLFLAEAAIWLGLSSIIFGGMWMMLSAWF